MLIPLSWLAEYVDLKLPTTELAERLTLAGLEVAAIKNLGDQWDPDTIRVGEVIAVRPHPDADRLVLVDILHGAEEPEQVVTGAPNLFQYKGCSVEAGNLPVLKAPFARKGALLVDAYTDERPRPMKKLKPNKIRGIKSSGMVCSELELGLSEEHEGILMLPDDAPTGAPLRDYLGEEIIELELTPDMSRCLNLIGLAREVAALTNAELHLPADVIENDDSLNNVADYIDVRIDEPDLCNRYTGILIKDVTIGPSPKWMQERLTAAGMRPINNIVDITNYVMLEWGQPLHAFDYDILQKRAESVGDKTPTIIVRRAAPKSKFTTLDGVEREMDETMLMIADTAGDVAIGGVMGGLESEVHNGTTNVFLEAATFEGINNRRTGQALRLTSEASHRFARGIPATLNAIGGRRAAELMREHAGGKIAPGMVDAYPVPQPEKVVYTTATDTRRLLGLAVDLPKIVSSLERLDFKVSEIKELPATADEEATFALQIAADEPILASVAPWHRLDIRYPADLTEEVARMIGYEEIGTTLIDDVLPPQRRDPILRAEDQVRDALVGIGLQETINYPLTTVENHDKLIVTGANGAPQHVENVSNAEGYVSLANPGTSDRQTMRRSLVVSALENLAHNLRFTDRLATFEIGRVYLPEEPNPAGDTMLPQEQRGLTITMCGPRETQNLYADSAAEEMDIFDLKGVVETMLTALGFKDEEIGFVAAPNVDSFGPRCAEVLLHGKRLGLMGEIHPQVTNAFGLAAGRVCVANLRIAPLVTPDWRVDPMQAISNYPPIVEDLAFIVAESVTARDVREVIAQSGGDVLAEIELFDIYRGDPLAAHEKSLAYRLVYQSAERSLHEKEVSKLRGKIIRSVEHRLDGKLRG